MEFLGINLSLAGWSYVLFGVNLYFYTNTALASLSKPKLFGMVSMIFSYILLQITTLVYALATKQPGFILTLVFQSILLLIMLTFHRRVTSDQD